jgi:cytochrome c6
MLKITTIVFSVLFGLLLLSDIAHADGTALYSKCKTCHGATGQGNPAMAKMFKTTPETLAFNDGLGVDCVKITTEGREKMPAYGKKMSATEIKEVCDFIKTLKK